MSHFIPLSVPNLKGNERRYVTEVIDAEWVSTGGAMINRFEQEIAAYLGVETAVACQSGTAGLHLAMLLAGVGQGDEVLVPTLTFIAAVNPVRYAGAEPVFLDCDDSLCLDVDKLEAFCREACIMDGRTLLNKRTGKPIKAVVVVHVFGNMADMERLMPVAERYGLTVIEDATEALGTYYTHGRYQGKHAGTIGDFGVYSFNGNKIITTGGGGMLVARDSAQAKRARYLSTQAKDDEVQFIHHAIGYNYRMTNLQAALGVAQLEQLETFIGRKIQNYQHYRTELHNWQGLRLLPFRDDIRSNHWFYSLCLAESPLQRDALIQSLTAQSIQTRPVWGLIHEQQPYRASAAYRIERASYFHQYLVNIPCSSNLTDADVEVVCGAIKSELLARAAD